MSTFQIPRVEIPFISPEELEFATQEEVASYEAALRRAKALESPLDLAELLFPETRRWQHLELLNEHLVALAEYRLTKDGPGLPDSTILLFDEASETLTSATCLYRPDALTLPVRVPIVFNLSVSMRPRAGKSRLINQVLPVWLLLHDPNLLIAVGTYSDSFADEWGEMMRDNCIDEQERLPFLPQPQGGRRAARDVFKVEGHKGRIAFTGVGGGINGKGFQVMIGDDFIKNDVEAQSPTTRQGAKNFYDSTWTTRRTVSFSLDARFPIPFEVLMGTRWHHDDILGYACYDTDEDGARQESPAWCILNIPAMCEDEDTDPLGRKLGEVHPNAAAEGADFLEKKKIQNPRVYAALYQGRPSPEGGGLIPNTFNTYIRKGGHADGGTDDLEFFMFEKLTGNVIDGGNEEDRFVTSTAYVHEMIPFCSIDMAATKKTTSDYTVAFNCLYSREHHALFIVDRFRKRITTDEYEASLIPFARGIGVKKWLVEDVTFGKQFGQTLRRKYKFQVDTYPAMADKVSRAVSSTLPDMMRNLQVYVLPTAPWREGTEAEIGEFPHSDHDDMVDALAAAAQYVSDMPRYRPPKDDTPKSLGDEIDEHVDKQARRTRRRQSRDPWAQISR